VENHGRKGRVCILVDTLVRLNVDVAMYGRVRIVGKGKPKHAEVVKERVYQLTHVRLKTDLEMEMENMILRDVEDAVLLGTTATGFDPKEILKTEIMHSKHLDVTASTTDKSHTLLSTK